ncbi:MAG: hypothetical protein JW893_01725 [Candidatus Omnitrophica bacterium]|nr:hypothetical protein [Candidatus Omnitrophota bacterium]
MDSKRERNPKSKNRLPQSKMDKLLDSAKDSLDMHNELERLKKQLQQLREVSAHSEERLQDIEIHINLLTRFITTLCVEKFGMRIGVMKRLVKRIEKDAIRESQISHLESLYRLSQRPKQKGSSPPPKQENDPWDEIS